MKGQLYTSGPHALGYPLNWSGHYDIDNTHPVLDGSAFEWGHSLLDNSSDYTVYWTNWDYPSLELPRNSQVGLITLYSITTFLALLGNTTALVVLILGNRSRTDLTKYLINLTVADLCMACFCIPFSFTKAMLGKWIFGQYLCPVVLFMQVTSVAVSIFTNMAIGIDRYIAVLHPLKTRFTKTKTKLVILLVWFSSFLLSVCQLFVGRSTVQYYDGSNYRECSEHWPSDAAGRVYTLCLLTLTYVLPLAALTYTYYKIGMALWKRRSPGNADVVRDQKQVNAKRKTTKMLATIVLVFAVCWLPVHLFNAVIDLAPQVMEAIITKNDERLFLGLYYVAHWLAMANSMANPVIYCFLNESFQADFKYIIRRKICRAALCLFFRRFWRHCRRRVHQGSHHSSMRTLTSTRSWKVKSWHQQSSSSTTSFRSSGSRKTIICVKPGGKEEIFVLQEDKPQQNLSATNTPVCPSLPHQY